MSNTHKIYMGSWCFTFGFSQPANLDTVIKVLSAFGYDGIALGAGFAGHAAPEQFPDSKSRQSLLDKIHNYDLEVAGYAPDPYSYPWATDKDALRLYEEYFDSCLQMASDLGSPSIRVDPGSFGPLSRDADYNAVWDRVVSTFKKQSIKAQNLGITLLWEFETGQIFVKPSEIVKIVDDVDEPNFKISYDFGHAQAVSVLAHNQVQPFEKPEKGQFGLIEMLKGKIGDVGINDCDNNTYQNLFGNHLGLGRGNLDIESLINAIVNSGFSGPWWASDIIPMDPIVWSDAWNARFVIRDILKTRFS